MLILHFDSLVTELKNEGMVNVGMESCRRWMFRLETLNFGDYGEACEGYCLLGGGALDGEDFCIGVVEGGG